MSREIKQVAEFYCDRCKKRFTPPVSEDGWVRQYKWLEVSVKKKRVEARRPYQDVQETISENWMLCPDCARDFLNFAKRDETFAIGNFKDVV